MSQHTYYQAFPEECDLYRRLCRDRAFHVLYANLVLLGPGPFFLGHLPPSDVNGTLDWLARNDSTIASRAEAERLLTDLREEVGRAAISRPGIEQQTAYFEQVQEEIEEVLVEHIQDQGHPSAELLANKLLYGEEPLAPSLFDRSGLALDLVPSGTVRKGVRMLEGLTPAVLEGSTGDPDLVTDYEQWWSQYRKAAQRREVIVILNA